MFDGVHLAHQRILKETVDKAKAIHGTSVAVTFWPHPKKEDSLISLAHRLKIISQIGIDVCIVIKFTSVFSSMTAEDFIDDILINKIGAQYIYVGNNFRFGRSALGDSRLLIKLSKLYNYKLRLFNVIKISGRPISSTYIRRLITRGKLKIAQKLLGRPVGVFGSVVKGISLGRKIGFPTANIDPHHEILPPSGIYAVKIILGPKKLKGVCYIGSNPTVKRSKFTHPKKNVNIETYVFNFNKDIYGKYLEMQFIKKIREEKKFRSLESLKNQIKKDISQAERIFALH